MESASDRPFVWGRKTYIMGILNVTPDSFSDGGQYDTVETAIARARELVEAGADLLDLGGQSTRPGAREVSPEQERDRVIPVVRSLRDPSSPFASTFENLPISVDTTRASVAEAAVEAGATWVNDVSGGLADPQMLPTIAALGVGAILMHMRGTPQTMQQLTDYDDLIGEIYRVLETQIDAAIAAGIPREKIVVDPGIGFAKTYEQNLEILRKIPVFRRLGVPVLIGPSRKSFIGHLLDRPDPKQRVWGTAAACCAAIAGGADIVRVHDVAEMADVCRVADAIFRVG